MQFFRGDRIAGTFQVSVCEGDPDSLDAIILRPLRYISRHSPDGFAWGRINRGAADLALAICSEILGHNAPVMIARFVVVELIAPLDAEKGWTLPRTRVLDSMARAYGAAGSGLGQVRL